jgi:hypothetical protein
MDVVNGGGIVLMSYATGPEEGASAGPVEKVIVTRKSDSPPFCLVR